MTTTPPTCPFSRSSSPAPSLSLSSSSDCGTRGAYAAMLFAPDDFAAPINVLCARMTMRSNLRMAQIDAGLDRMLRRINQGTKNDTSDSGSGSDTGSEDSGKSCRNPMHLLDKNRGFLVFRGADATKKRKRPTQQQQKDRDNDDEDGERKRERKDDEDGEREDEEDEEREDEEDEEREDEFDGWAPSTEWEAACCRMYKNSVSV